MSTSTVSEIDVDIGLQPKQWQLDKLIENSKATTFGYGGRRGGGKSGGMRRIFLRRRLAYPGTDGILLRRTYQELKDNHLEPMLKEWPYIREWWRAEDKAIICPGGGRLLFRYAEHETDIDKLFGVEYADIGPEEAGLFSQRELEKMKGSNRHPGMSAIKPSMLMSFMPGGKSHFYLKRIFVDRQYESNEDPEDFAFVEAFGWDNVEWCRKLLARDGLTARDFYLWSDDQRKAYFLTSDYGRKLASITDSSLREAWLYGSWNVFEGLIFPELSESLHNLDNWTHGLKTAGMKLLSAIDWADSGTVGAEQCAIDAAGNLFFFDEYSQRNKTVVEHSAAITAMLNSHGKQEYTIMDLPVNNINQDNLFSIQNAFMLAGLPTIQAYRANIAIGLDLMKQYLKVDPNRFHPFTQELGSPRIFISKRRCPQLWRQATEIQRAIDADTGKVKYIGDDDNLDPARYLCMSRPRAPEEVKEKQFNIDYAASYTSIEQKVIRSLAKFDKKFGKEPNENEWFPQ